ncbi:hypothetical protein [Flavilitoribacter nigricans]|uniref:Uncharacterized protein n=1 Tax=Flavilitoribacter nigricans (strain ATCC 23147 / DSM 23189 / NBRC 102662 / NCIMB 1420 / SS-2) TaxID=1122177 RepID=A0A2D0N8K0_FLAN2|nr:hypothetical protein [Flavilitoribacter nigricans]PHN04807.1 hypothetical protein CRP01_20060 [Flavilitoribacter nigricans DSM 23189 = NBRC 102662]
MSNIGDWQSEACLFSESVQGSFAVEERQFPGGDGERITINVLIMGIPVRFQLSRRRSYTAAGGSPVFIKVQAAISSDKAVECRILRRRFIFRNQLRITSPNRDWATQLQHDSNLIGHFLQAGADRAVIASAEPQNTYQLLIQSSPDRGAAVRLRAIYDLLELLFGYL